MAKRHPWWISARPHRRGAGLVWTAVAACLFVPVHARSADLGGTVALGSQLVDRGVAITPATPVLQGAVSWNPAPNWSLGLSTSVEMRSPGRTVEALAQVSRHWSLSDDWRIQAGLLYYDYPGRGRSMAAGQTEASVNWIYRDVFTFGLSAIRVSGGQDRSLHGAADLDFHWPLTRHVSFSAGAGIAQPPAASYGYGYDRPNLYGYGHAGLMWDTGSWRMELDRIMTSLETRRQRGSWATSPWVATISWSF